MRQPLECNKQNQMAPDIGLWGNTPTCNMICDVAVP